jgi:hypothetical protein
LPVFVTLYVYWIESPTLAAFWSAAGVTVAIFCSATAGLGEDGVCVDDGFDGGHAFPYWSVHDAVAVSLVPPLSTSLWVTMYGTFAVHVSEAPAASPGAGGVGQVAPLSVGSDTEIVGSASFPVLVTR